MSVRCRLLAHTWQARARDPIGAAAAADEDDYDADAAGSQEVAGSGSSSSSRLISDPITLLDRKQQARVHLSRSLASVSTTSRANASPM